MLIRLTKKQKGGEVKRRQTAKFNERKSATATLRNEKGYKGNYEQLYVNALGKTDERNKSLERHKL